jgi:alpha-ketoglutarate-dependent taurine dioxygenase
MIVSKMPGFGSYGQIIDDIDFSTLSHEEWIDIGKSHLKNLVTVFRNPKGLTPDEYIRRIGAFGPNKGSVRAHFARKYGRMLDAFDPSTLEGVSEEDKEYLMSRVHMIERTEEGNYVTRIYGAKDKDGNMLGNFDSGDLGWHSNESGQLSFAPEVSLMGSELMLNSATGFMQTADYYESVTESFRSELDDMVVIHNYRPGGISPAELDNPKFQVQIRLNSCPEENLETPLVVTSPGGIRGLHFTINSATRIKGMSQEESDKIFNIISAEVFTDKYTYYHHYQHNNDLLLFDNSITLHCRLKGEPDRKAFRIQYEPCNLLEDAWYPYDQPEYMNRCVDLNTDLMKILSLKDYKLAKKI